MTRLEERTKVTRQGCWEWTGPRKAKGYGVVRIAGKSYATHRLAYERLVGQVPEGLCVLHRCDNPPCWRPDHLFTGTIGENNADRDGKGRGAAKLTADDVRAIRGRLTGRYGNLAALAREFGVTVANIHAIASRRSWRNID